MFTIFSQSSLHLQAHPPLMYIVCARLSHSLGLAILALTIGATSTFAHGASVDEAATAAQQKKMAACKFEWGSLQEMCKAAAGWGMPVMMREHDAMIDTAVERYQAAVAACNGMRGGNRDICVSRAGVPAMITTGMK